MDIVPEPPRRRGRPPGGEKDALIRVRCDGAEKLRWSALAAAGGLTLSEWLRRRANATEAEGSAGGNP